MRGRPGMQNWNGLAGESADIPLPTQNPPTRRGIIVDVMVESADKFVDFMGMTTKARVGCLFRLLFNRKHERFVCGAHLCANLSPDNVGGLNSAGLLLYRTYLRCRQRDYRQRTSCVAAFSSEAMCWAQSIVVFVCDGFALTTALPHDAMDIFCIL